MKPRMLLTLDEEGALLPAQVRLRAGIGWGASTVCPSVWRHKWHWLFVPDPAHALRVMCASARKPHSHAHMTALIRIAAPRPNPAARRAPSLPPSQLDDASSQVRVGQAVDVVAQAGRPKTITGFQVGAASVARGGPCLVARPPI
jgi:hypothetical protein